MKFNNNYKSYINKNKLYGKRGYNALNYHCKEIFSSVESFDGKTMIDVGGGDGLISTWALTKGIKKLVIVEPESAGARHGGQDKIIMMKNDLGIKKSSLKLVTDTFQNYDPQGLEFDYVLSHNSINHLDENACKVLHHSRVAYHKYILLFNKLYKMVKPGGLLIIADCGRFNIWNKLGLTAPLGKNIEWSKHQEPSVWKKIAIDSGFYFVSLNWRNYYPLRKFELLIKNKIFAVLTASLFILTFKKKD